jgi:hypothetical protein
MAGFSAAFRRILATRLPSLLKKRATKDASFLGKLASKINASSATAKVSASIKSIVDWVKANPMNSVLVATALSSLGVNVVDLMGNDDAIDGESAPIDESDKELLVNVQREGQRALVEARKRASENLLEFGSDSEDFDVENSDDDRMAKDEAMIAVLKWSRAFFGSEAAALRAHVMLQAFVEVPYAEVARGFQIYNLR